MTTALSAVQTALWGILTFSILVVLHEMGHFLAARAFGVKVHEFMVGLPGPSLRLHTKNMDWGITAVPLGGYVRIAGMEPGAEDDLLGDALAAFKDGGPLSAAALGQALGVTQERADAICAMLTEWKAIVPEGEDRFALALDGDVAGLGSEALLSRARASTYRGQGTGKRITILAMGVVTNLVLAVLTFTVVLSVWGYYDLTTRIDSVDSASPAAEAGLVVGDTLVAVDGDAVSTWDDFQLRMAQTKPGQNVTITYEREGRTIDARVTLAGRESHGYFGVGPTAVEVHPSVFESLNKSIGYIGFTFGVILDLFDPSKFSGTVKSFTGVVGVSVMAQEAAQAGPLSYAGLIAMLSLSLGLMNILPFPPLDGGKIVLEIVERVIGRPISRSITLGLSAAGAVMLFSLIGYVMYLDILRYAS